MTQMGMDTAVVTGGTAVGTLAGGPVAATILFGATTGRKAGKVLESTIKMVIDISKSLKKINNQHKITPYKKENELPLGKTPRLNIVAKPIKLELGKKERWVYLASF